MGWLISNHIPYDIREEIHRICSYEWDNRSISPIAAEQVGDVWYVAVRGVFKDPELGRRWVEETGFTPDLYGSYVFAGVILTSIENGEWGYKAMDETSGPYECAAPRSILKLLSPTSNEYALDWRKRCWDNLNQTV